MNNSLIKLSKNKKQKLTEQSSKISHDVNWVIYNICKEVKNKKNKNIPSLRLSFS